MLSGVPVHAWTEWPSRVAMGAAITVSFALLALVLRGVNRSGAVAGGAACLVLFVCAGPGAFATLVTLFVLTWLATRFGFRRKQELGLAERGEGRNAWQVLANLAAAAVCVVAAASTGNSGWLVAAAAALAESATDTVASEIGQTDGRTSYLLTTWRPVAAGTDGGITAIGTLAGAIAGLIVAGVAAAAGMIPVQRLWIAAISGILGMLFDSLLGATVQGRGWMNNDAVNIVSTIFAALLALVLAG